MNASGSLRLLIENACLSWCWVVIFPFLIFCSNCSFSSETFFTECSSFIISPFFWSKSFLILFKSDILLEFSRLASLKTLWISRLCLPFISSMKLFFSANICENSLHLLSSDSLWFWRSASSSFNFSEASLDVLFLTVEDDVSFCSKSFIARSFSAEKVFCNIFISSSLNFMICFISCSFSLVNISLSFFISVFLVLLNLVLASSKLSWYFRSNSSLILFISITLSRWVCFDLVFSISSSPFSFPMCCLSSSLSLL